MFEVIKDIQKAPLGKDYSCVHPLNQAIMKSSQYAAMMRPNTISQDIFRCIKHHNSKFQSNISSRNMNKTLDLLQNPTTTKNNKRINFHKSPKEGPKRKNITRSNHKTITRRNPTAEPLPLQRSLPGLLIGSCFPATPIASASGFSNAMDGGKKSSNEGFKKWIGNMTNPKNIEIHLI